jgi:WD40 repeat protein
MGGYSFLILLDDDLQEAPIAIPIEPVQKTFDVDFTPDGEILYYSVYGKVMAYNVPSNSIQTAWTNPAGQSAPFNNISPDGKYLAIYANTQFAILDLATLKEVFHIPNATVRSRQTPAFNEQSNRLTVFADELHKIIVYEIPTWLVISEIALTAPGTAAISPDGKTAALSTLENPEIKLIDLESQTELWSMKPAFEPLTMMKFNPDGSLLFISGMADETADMEENTWYLDTSSGENLGGLLTMDPPNSLLFSEDGISFLFFDGSKYSISLWGAKTEEMVKIEEILRTYFEAINQKDYSMAASLTELNSYAMDEVITAGLDPTDLPGTFATLCQEDSVPCLPLGKIVAIYADVSEEWDYVAYLTLVNPDGSEVLFDDITRYERIWLAKDGQGSFIITDLHPGMRYPYQ